MVTARKDHTRGHVDGFKATSQFNSQAAAVTPIAYTASGAISVGDNVVDLNQAVSADIQWDMAW